MIQQIHDFRQGSLNLSGYYTNLKTLGDNLDGTESPETCLCCNTTSCLSQRAAKAKVKRSRTIKFFAGLNEKYSIIRSQILMSKPLPDLDEICNILDQDDIQRQFNSVITPAAFQVSHGVSQSTTLSSPSNSATSGALAGDSNASTQSVVNAFQRKPGAVCSHCGNTGHVADRCYKLHGYPVGWKKGKWNTDKPPQTKPPAVAANVAVQETTSPVSGLDNLIGKLNKDQIQNFIVYFISQLQLQPDRCISPASASQHTDQSGISFSSSTFQFY